MKSVLSYLIILLLCVRCSEAQNKVDQNMKNVFPGKSWAIQKPENLGYSTKKLAKAKSMFEKSGGVAALVIVKGYIIADWGLTDLNLDCRSIRKSLISSLFGVYMEKGEIDYDQTLQSLKINDKNKLTEAEEKTQIKYLLSSSSGVYLPAAFEEQSHWNKPERGSKKPGSHFQYNNWDFNVLSTVFNKSTKQDLLKAFDAHIAQPLQMEHFMIDRNTAYLYQPGISEHPAYIFQISTKDLARYSLLYLNKGNWNGKQIIPEKWVEESTNKQIETGENFYYNYGYLWWVSKRENAKGKTPFLARGAQSQFMYIDPANELIIIFRDNPNAIEKVKKSEAYPLIGAVYGAKIK